MEAKKPSYLGLLNAIALGEGRAHQYLNCWAAKTDDPDVRKVLQTVAIREGEHSHAFTKRLCELGYAVMEREDPTFAKSMEIANADCSDLEKFEAFGYGRPEGRDPFAGVFDDQTIDIRTGELLGRYIAEERDSGRRLRAEYERVCAEATEAGSSARAAAEPGGHDNEILMVSLKSGVKELADCVAGLQDDIAKLRREVKKLKNR